MSHRLKIVFFGSSAFAVPILEALSREHEVVAVVTQPSRPVGRKMILTPTPIAQWVSEHIPTTPIHTFEKLRDPIVANTLLAYHADLYIVAAYGKILPEEILNLARYKTLNVHASLLPQYRGASPIQAALKNGDAVTGNTIMVMDALMDHGKIVSQSEVPIASDDTYETLEQKLSADGAALLLQTLPGYISGEIIPQEQDHEQATHVKLIEKKDGAIDPKNQTATEIFNAFRAYSHWPGIYLFIPFKGALKRTTITATCPAKYPLKPGVLTSDSQHLYLGCKEGSLEILSLTPEGAKELSANECINGFGPFSDVSVETNAQ